MNRKKREAGRGIPVFSSCLLQLPPLAPIVGGTIELPTIARPGALPEPVVNRLLGRDLEIDVEGPDIGNRELDPMGLVRIILTDPRILIRLQLPLKRVDGGEADVELNVAILDNLHDYYILSCFVYQYNISSKKNALTKGHPYADWHMGWCLYYSTSYQ